MAHHSYTLFVCRRELKCSLCGDIDNSKFGSTKVLPCSAQHIFCQACFPETFRIEHNCPICHERIPLDAKLHIPGSMRLVAKTSTCELNHCPRLRITVLNPSCWVCVFLESIDWLVKTSSGILNMHGNLWFIASSNMEYAWINCSQAWFECKA